MQTKETTDGAKKVFDENNELACGFCSLQILDQDGYARKTKGSSIEGPWFFEAEGDSVCLVASFAPNPLFYLEISSENDKYLFGKFWLGEKDGPTSSIVTLVPKKCKAICDEKEGDGFAVEAEMPLADPREDPTPIRVQFVTKDARLVTKVTHVRVVIPVDKWVQFKSMRAKFWRATKAWGGQDKDEDKKKEDKDGEKKDGEAAEVSKD